MDKKMHRIQVNNIQNDCVLFGVPVSQTNNITWNWKTIVLFTQQVVYRLCGTDKGPSKYARKYKYEAKQK